MSTSRMRVLGIVVYQEVIGRRINELVTARRMHRRRAENRMNYPRTSC